MMPKNRRPFILIPIAIFLLIPLVVMYLWNHIVVVIFGITTITYIQAVGLFILSKILFGGIGNFGRHRKNSTDRFRSKMLNMSDEEREAMLQEWKKRGSCDK